MELKRRSCNLKPTVIVVDDDRDTVRLFSELLIENGIDVVGKGYDGKTAIELFQEKNPDFTFVDIMMPNGSGIHAIRKIRESNPDAKIIAVTADVRSSTEDKLEELKTDAIVYKPFDIKKILQMIQN